LIYSMFLFSSMYMTGCGEKVQTVDYFKNHPEIAEKVKKDCEVARAQPKNCENVAAAFRAARREASRNAQPIKDW
jgi:hypothetical protein